MSRIVLERRLKFIFLLPVVTVCALLVLLSVLAPIMEKQQLPISQNLYALLHNICHQLPTRCYWILDRPFGLCARCFGLYLSILITGSLFIFQKVKMIKFRFDLYLIAPIIIEPLFEYLDVWKSNNCIRFATGVSAGIGCIFIYLLIMYKISLMFKRFVKTKHQ